MTRVADVMTSGVLSLRSDTPLREAIAYLATQHISGTAVVDPRMKLAGAVTTSDLLQAEAEGVDLDMTTVADVMSFPALTIVPEAELRDAALAMEYAEVHRLFVEECGALVGVVSRSDINRAMARGIAG